MSQLNPTTVFEGSEPRLPPGSRVAVAVARWNDAVTRRLLAGALHQLAQAGLGPDEVDVAWVPGAFELGFAADRLAATGRYAAILCLGAIIRGETSHDRYIAHACAAGIDAVARQRGLPVLFGVLTCETLAQALARAAGDPTDGFAGNKGAESAAAAVEMVRVAAAIAAGGGVSGEGAR
jgi:6,7-dimethyl-8-ribityllumazine synthase